MHTQIREETFGACERVMGWAASKHVEDGSKTLRLRLSAPGRSGAGFSGAPRPASCPPSRVYHTGGVACRWGSLEAS